jgi:hypothetical protein
LQFDALRDDSYRALRGEPLCEMKERAVAALGQHDLRTILVTTVEPGVNDDQLGAIVAYGLERRWVTGVSFQPATYAGRHELLTDLERRVTFPDVIRLIAEQTGGQFQESDFLPLPCAHPNCHSLTYAYRGPSGAVPITRLLEVGRHLDLLANGITFNRPAARRLMETYIEREAGGQSGCCGPHPQAAEFIGRALREDLSPADVFRITITSFLDAYNFDLRRLMKCCVHHVLPSGHIIPFCAYNVLYRQGHVPLPPLRGGLHSLGPPS